MLFDKSYYF